MKKLINLLAIVGVIGAAALMNGCGGSDDNSNNNNNGAGQGTVLAPASVANKTVTLTENGQSRDITFGTSGNSFTQFENGTTNAIATGNFQWVQQGNNNGQLILTTTRTDGGATNSVTYVLTFNNANSGTYTFATSGGQTGSGTFSNFQDVTTGGNTGGGNTGGGNTGGGNTGGGNTGGGNTGGGSTNAPTSLAGHAIDFTASGQGNERLTFAGSGNSVTSDAVNPPNNTATYTFTPGTAGGTPGTLVVTFPNGDVYNLTMNFTDATHGTWSGTQHFDNADHPVPAGSSFTIQQ